MDNKELKNASFIRDLEENKNRLRVIREHFESSYNSNHSKLVAQTIRQAEHWIDDHIETLK